MKKVLIPLLSLAICLTVFWKWTIGFTVFTIFSYTLVQAGEMPRAFPSFDIITQDQEIINLKDKEGYKLINFVYLNCPYACHKINNRIDEIYPSFKDSISSSNLEFVTISFDLERDDIKKIKNYRSIYGDDIDGWTFALPYGYQKEEFFHILNKIGVWAYQDPNNYLINHSIYLYLISPDNKVIKTFDPARENNGVIIQQIRRCLKEGKA